MVALSLGSGVCAATRAAWAARLASARAPATAACTAGREPDSAERPRATGRLDSIGARGFGALAMGETPARPVTTGLDEGAGAGTLDAVARVPGLACGPAWLGAPVPLADLGAGGGVSGRRAVEVFIVLFAGLEALSFTSTRRALRE